MLVHHRPAMRIELLVVELEPGRVGCVACKNLAVRRRGLDRVTRAVDLERQLVLTLVVRLEVLDRVPLEDDLGKPVRTNTGDHQRTEESSDIVVQS